MKLTTLRHVCFIALGAASILAATAGFRLAQAQAQAQQTPSIITIDVVGFGGE